MYPYQSCVQTLTCPYCHNQINYMFPTTSNQNLGQVQINVLPIAGSNKLINYGTIPTTIEDYVTRPKIGGTPTVCLSPTDKWGYLVNPVSWLVIDKKVDNDSIYMNNIQPSPNNNSQLWGFTKDGLIINKLDNKILTLIDGKNLVCTPQIHGNLQQWAFVMSSAGPLIYNISTYRNQNDVSILKINQSVNVGNTVICGPYIGPINGQPLIDSSWVFMPI